jgi:hypothetical protein
MIKESPSPPGFAFGYAAASETRLARRSFSVGGHIRGGEGIPLHYAAPLSATGSARAGARRSPLSLTAA